MLGPGVGGLLVASSSPAAVGAAVSGLVGDLEGDLGTAPSSAMIAAMVRYGSTGVDRQQARAMDDSLMMLYPAEKERFGRGAGMRANKIKRDIDGLALVRVRLPLSTVTTCLPNNLHLQVYDRPVS